MNDLIHGLGAHPSPDDDRDHPLEEHLAFAAILPARFILPAPQFPPPLNQGKTPRCVGYSGALLRSLTEYPDSGREDFDADDAYAQCKLIDGITGDGSTGRAMCEVALKTGLLVKAGPLKGRRLKIASYSRVSGLAEIKQAIFAGGCQSGENWGNSQFHPLADGTLPAFDFSAGGHETVFGGWDDNHPNPDGTRGALLLRNSWGNWGITVSDDAGRPIAGCAWFPYSYLTQLWEAWKTFDAPDGGLMQPGTFDVIGTLNITSAHQAYRMADGVLTAVLPLGPTPVVGSGQANGVAVWYLVVAGALVAFGKQAGGVDTGTYTPAAAAASFTIAGTVGGANAAVTWK